MLAEGRLFLSDGVWLSDEAGPLFQTVDDLLWAGGWRLSVPRVQYDRILEVKWEARMAPTRRRQAGNALGRMNLLRTAGRLGVYACPGKAAHLAVDLADATVCVPNGSAGIAVLVCENRARAQAAGASVGDASVGRLCVVTMADLLEAAAGLSYDKPSREIYGLADDYNFVR